MPIRFDAQTLDTSPEFNQPQLLARLEAFLNPQYSGEGETEVTPTLAAILKFSHLKKRGGYGEATEQISYQLEPEEISEEPFSLKYARVVKGDARDFGKLHYLMRDAQGNWWFCFPRAMVFAPGELDIHLIELVKVTTE